jgi:peptidoglycan/LPS O-acetylase OafA/YrhL
MKSSGDIYLSKIDHLRAFAAFQVFAFHFLHHSAPCGMSMCIAHNYRPDFPLFTFLNEGQMGVSLFMCLSGYIFAYLTHSSAINPLLFSYNRLLRLMPLIIFWDIITKLFYAIEPVTGTWSVYIEIQYYMLFPAIHIYMRAYKIWPLAFLLACLFAGRLDLWMHGRTLNDWAYYSILGRGDQLLLGSIAFYAERWLKTFKYHKQIIYCLGALGIAAIAGMYQYFTFHGGYVYYPAKGFYWVVYPLVDGLCFSLITMCYLQLSIPAALDRVLSATGRWAYSIYLNQFFFIPLFFVITALYVHIPEQFYPRLVLAVVVFPLLVMCSSLTYKIIERPFLRFRKPYILNEAQGGSLAGIVHSMSSNKEQKQ